MTTDKIIAGINILSPYYAKPHGYNLGADHDVLYMYATERPVSEDDRRKLIELGWGQEACCVEGEYKLEHYNPDESWSAYL